MPEQTKTTKFKSEGADYNRCMATYGPSTTLCAGERVVVVGYVCPHCESSDPSTNCLSPRDVIK
jgi:hypothetical protein